MNFTDVFTDVIGSEVPMQFCSDLKRTNLCFHSSHHQSTCCFFIRKNYLNQLKSIPNMSVEMHHIVLQSAQYFLISFNGN